MGILSKRVLCQECHGVGDVVPTFGNPERLSEVCNWCQGLGFVSRPRFTIMPPLPRAYKLVSFLLVFIVLVAIVVPILKEKGWIQ